MENERSKLPQYIVGEIPHTGEFLRIPGAKVIVDNTENAVRVEAALAVVGRIASTHPNCKVRYWISVDG